MWCFSLEEASTLIWFLGGFSWREIKYACRTSAQHSTFSKCWEIGSETRRNPGFYSWATRFHGAEHSFGLLQAQRAMHRFLQELETPLQLFLFSSFTLFLYCAENIKREMMSCKEMKELTFSSGFPGLSRTACRPACWEAQVVGGGTVGWVLL